MSTNTAPITHREDLRQRLANGWTKVLQSPPYLREFLVNAVAQVRIYRKAYPGVMHGLIFWGVTIQVLGTLINLMQMQLFVPLVELPFPRGRVYLTFETVMDLAGVAILLGVGMAVYRRLIWRPKTLETRWDDYYALTLLGLIPLAGFTLEALRLVAAAPAWAGWSPVGNQVARLFIASGMSRQTAAALHPFLFWAHASLGLLLVASMPFTKLRHLVTTPLHILLRRKEPAGSLVKIENIEEAETLGVGSVGEFLPRQLLSFDACTRCGRCEENCPACLSGLAYSPRTFTQSLRQAMLDTLETTNGNGHSRQEPAGLDAYLDEGVAWSCTTCGACLNNCPAFVNPVEQIIDLRRYQVLTTGKIPKGVADVLRNLERQGNPWGMPPDDRLAWAEGLDIRELAPGDETDVLLFVGCAFAFDERNKKVARSFVQLLQSQGVNFGILGYDEGCCGESARRLGHEYLFQVFAEQNIEAMQAVKFQRIVTQCPHCFNTLKNEYPQMGGNFRVQHYTEFLAEILPAQLRANRNGARPAPRLTYHDSCYLGRYNGIIAQPRQLLDRSNLQRVEMRRSKQESLCCGGGGGQMWFETDAETRINHLRLEDARATQAEMVATACPYCLIMFDDALRSKGLSDQIQVLDIAEVLAKDLQKEKLA